MKEDILKNLSGELPDLELMTPSELVGAWCESIEGDIERPLTTCIKKFDKDLRNKLRGTVGAYIGYGGSKKSLFALQACKRNVLQYENNCTGIYSNMEMAIYQFLSRLMDMTFEVSDKSTNASWYFETQYETAFKSKNKDEKAKVKKMISEYFHNYYGQNLLISNQTGMRIEDYDRLIKQAKTKRGRVDIMVIDGLSMMSGIGNETEQYTTNSKELKDLAKMHNIFIPLICHLSKGADRDSRDIRKFIRGSEKILDNVDFDFQLSLIVDESRNTSNSKEYLTDKGYIKFYNKRGTGNTINTIYDFDKITLTIQETDEDVNNYDSQKNNNKSFF